MCAIQKPQNEAVSASFGRSATDVDVDVAAAEKRRRRRRRRKRRKRRRSFFNCKTITVKYPSFFVHCATVTRKRTHKIQR